MTKKDKIGLWVLIGMFVVLGLVLFFSIPRPTKTSGTFSDNVIVRQRMINYEKSN